METRIAARLQQLMKAFDETAESLAFTLDLSVRTVTRVLEGKAAPTEYELFRLGRYFNRAPSWIYYGVDSWQAVPIAHQTRFEWLDTLWYSAVEHESTEEVDRAIFSRHIVGAGSRRISASTKRPSREAIDNEFRYLLSDDQHPFRHYYEE